MRWLDAPQPVLRLEIIRICAPLAILGFMSARLAHADEWIGDSGFRVPDLGASDWRQPLYLPGLPPWAAWSVAAVLVVSGLMVAAGFRPRPAAGIFAAASAYVALSDRLATFTVSKLAPVVALALALGPCGQRIGVDAWRAARRHPSRPLPSEISSGAVRFFQVLLPVVYSASGIAKLRGDWLENGHVLWTHLHDSYQTPVSWWLANTLPVAAWTVFQAATLAFEVLAPVWFALRWTRVPALVAGLTMHLLIGTMFGPVKYFAMLMASMLLGAYLPEPLLDALASVART